MTFPRYLTDKHTKIIQAEVGAREGTRCNVVVLAGVAKPVVDGLRKATAVAVVVDDATKTVCVKMLTVVTTSETAAVAAAVLRSKS